MKHPDLTQIIKKMQEGKNFELTRGQYLKYTGRDIPQNKSYTEHRSAVATKAKELGYKIIVVPEKMIFKRFDL